MASVSVFRSGKHTQTTLSFESGRGQQTITKRGSGCFLEPCFDTVAEAEAFCRKELEKDRAAIFLLFQDEAYAGTVMDREYHDLKSKRGERIFGLASVIVFSGIGLVMSLGLFPSHNIADHVFLALGIGVFSIVPREFMGRGNFEGAIVMVMLLALFGVSVSAMHDAQKRRVAAESHPTHADSK